MENIVPIDIYQTIIILWEYIHFEELVYSVVAFYSCHILMNVELKECEGV